MKINNVYIYAAEQISIQNPLSEQWMDTPLFYEDSLVKAVNPPFRDYLAPNEARRMGNLMKRALVTSIKVLKETGIDHPDAIITGTSIGSLDYTERFLDDLLENGEEALSPTYFMQSTHNTVGSALGIYTKTHGYNTTYSHGEISFDAALFDAWMQLQLDAISNALVSGHDEMIESFFELLRKTGYVGLDGMVPCGEVAMSMIIGKEKRVDSLCEISGIRLSYKPSLENFKSILYEMLHDADISYSDISAVMTGVNGNPQNDSRYAKIINSLMHDKPLFHYKHLFGENYTSSALGLYTAANLLSKQEVPLFIYDSSSPCECKSLNNIILLNMTNGGECSIIILKRICY